MAERPAEGGRRSSGRPIAVILLVLAALLAVAVVVGSQRSAAADVGSSAVYSRIASETDCPALQAEFDQASTNNGRAAAGTVEFMATLGYMKAADERMQALSCY